MTIYFSAICLSLFCFFDLSAASKILFIQPQGPKSQKIFYDGIVEALNEANHQITMISPFSRSKPLKNVEDIILESNTFEDIVGDPFESDNLGMLYGYITMSAPVCIDVLVRPQVQEVLERHYDLVILSIDTTECFLPILYKKNVLFMHANEYLPVGPLASMGGNLDFPSVSFAIFGASHPMSFLERANGAIWSLLLDLLIFNVMNPRIEKEMKELNLYPEGVPPIAEIQKKTSLMIANSVRELDYPVRPFVPSLIFAGGIHIPSGVEPLPEELETWIRSSGEEGFIIFSLGSTVPSGRMGERRRKMFLKVFSELKQKVYWKWDGEDMDDLPSNVKLSKWLPQTRLLAHPKIRLFITHGGHLSCLETTFFGVPVVGIPVYFDQEANLRRASKEGWGAMIEWAELSEEKLRLAVHSALYNQSMKQAVATRSRIMKDRPLTPSQEVTFWVDYVIRHGGAKHLSCPFATMSWMEIYNIDVWLLVASILICTLTIIIWCGVLCIKCLVRSCQSREGKKKVQ